MDRARHARVKAIFAEARELEGAAREEAIARACEGDEALAREVRSLLGFDHEDDVIAPRKAEATVDPASGPASGPASVPRPTGVDPLGLVGTTLDDRYRVEALVAEGGFGYVYRGVQVRWDRPVAVKVLKLERGDEALKQAFIKEGALMNDLSRRTTAIVQSYDVGTFTDAGGRPRVFLAIEWLDGRTLADLLAAERREAAEGRAPWSLARVIEVLRPVAGALAVAHARGIAHRDVKPANIFLADEDGHRVTKLLDFGVAKIAADHEAGFLVTGGAQAAFTLGYAAPEQISKRYGSTGPWTDVYALAIVAVELLVGRRVDGGGNLFQVASRFADPDARPTPARLGVEVPSAVEAVFARALAAVAADRFPDAGRFFEALEEAQRPKEIVTARTPLVAPDAPANGRGWVALAAALVVAALAAAIALVLRG